MSQDGSTTFLLACASGNVTLAWALLRREMGGCRLNVHARNAVRCCRLSSCVPFLILFRKGKLCVCLRATQNGDGAIHLAAKRARGSDMMAFLVQDLHLDVKELAVSTLRCAVNSSSL